MYIHVLKPIAKSGTVYWEIYTSFYFCESAKLKKLQNKHLHISETGRDMPIKIGVHALDINPYLHEFF